MSLSAWITMLSSWAIISIYTIYFFMKVLRTPQKRDDNE